MPGARTEIMRIDIEPAAMRKAETHRVGRDPNDERAGKERADKARRAVYGEKLIDLPSGSESGADEIRRKCARNAEGACCFTFDALTPPRSHYAGERGIIPFR